MKKLILLLLVCLLPACSNIRPVAERNGSLYDLGPVVTPIKILNRPDMALDVRFPAWLDVTSIQYRLRYHDATRLYEYALARWAGLPSHLLQQRLRVQMGLPMVQSDATAACVLKVEVQEFGQNFSSQKNSIAVIQGEARLFNKSRQQLATRIFSIEQPALTADARGGVNAMAVASDDLARQLREWLQLLPKTEGLAACRLS